MSQMNKWGTLWRPWVQGCPWVHLPYLMMIQDNTMFKMALSSIITMKVYSIHRRYDNSMISHGNMGDYDLVQKVSFAQGSSNIGLLRTSPCDLILPGK